MTILFKSRCYNGGNKHKFEPRVEEEDRPIDLSRNLPIFYMRPNEFREVITLKKYVRDVCVWCGDTIEREDQT